MNKLLPLCLLLFVSINIKAMYLKNKMNEVTITIANFQSIFIEPVLRLNGVVIPGDGAGNYSFDHNALLEDSNVITVDPTESLNGLSTLDVVLLLIGLTDDDISAVMSLASDVDRSGSLSTKDFVLMRKEILGITVDSENLRHRFIVDRFRDFTSFDPFDFNANTEFVFAKEDVLVGEVIEIEVFKIGDVSLARNSEYHKSLMQDKIPFDMILEDQFVKKGQTIKVPLVYQTMEKLEVKGSSFKLIHPYLQFAKVHSPFESSELLYNDSYDDQTVYSFINLNGHKQFFIEIEFVSLRDGYLSDLLRLDETYIADIVYDDLSSQSLNFSFGEKIVTELSLYPNPVSDFLVVDLPSTTHDFDITIMDVLGNVVSNMTGSDQFVIRHSDLGSRGVKILRFDNGERSFIKRIVVE